MKQYLIINRAFRPGLFDTIESTIYTDDTLDVAIKTVKEYNYRNWMYKKEIVELTTLVQVKPECNMSEDEMKVYKDTIIEMTDDLDKIIDYDEWAAREYGETRVDTWYSAKNLYDAGYRKITKLEE